MKSTTIEIPVGEFKKAIPGLSKIIPRHSSLPVLGAVKLSSSSEGIRIQANDLEQTVTALLKNGKAEGASELVVSFNELSDIAKKSQSADSLRLIDDGKEAVIVYQAAGTRIEKPITRFELEDFPSCFQPNGEPTILDESFKQAIKEAFQCASIDSSRYVLNGACLDTSNESGHYLVSTDGSHLYCANSFVFGIRGSLIIPQQKFLTWPGFMDDGVWTLWFQPEEAKTKTKALFRIDSAHWSYVGNPIEGDYPNWRQVVPESTNKTTKVILGEQAAKTILEALPLLPGVDDRLQPIGLEISDKELILKSIIEPISKVPIPGSRVTGSPMEVLLNRSFLAKALKFSCNEIGVHDPITPVVFKGQSKTLVVMPITGEAAERFIAANRPKTSPTQNPSAANIPSSAEDSSSTEQERKIDMAPTVPAVPQRGNLNGNENNGEECSSAIDDVLAKIDSIKLEMRKVLDDLQETEKLLRRAVKERKANEKEINRARNALRSLQSVEI